VAYEMGERRDSSPCQREFHDTRCLTGRCRRGTGSNRSRSNVVYHVRATRSCRPLAQRKCVHVIVDGNRRRADSAAASDRRRAAIASSQHSLVRRHMETSTRWWAGVRGSGKRRSVTESGAASTGQNRRYGLLRIRKTWLTRRGMRTAGLVWHPDRACFGKTATGPWYLARQLGAVAAISASSPCTRLRARQAKSRRTFAYRPRAPRAALDPLREAVRQRKNIRASAGVARSRGRTCTGQRLSRGSVDRAP